MSRKKSNRVKALRTSHGLTQSELAIKAGISRTAVCAIEGEQLIPSVATALSLANVLGTSVEALFGTESDEMATLWAWEPTDSRYWQAEIDGRIVRYPAHSSPMLTPLSNALEKPAKSNLSSDGLARQTLVIACCDPAAGLLATLYEQMTGLRMLVLPRSSGQALDLLALGLVHMAGLHFSTKDDPEKNAEVAGEKLGVGCHFIHVASWEEGVTASPSLKLKSVQNATRSKLNWIGREPGSGARQCLDRLLSRRATPRRVARHHRAVAEAVQSGWADAGVCVRLASAEAGLDFFPVQEESYDVCFSQAFSCDRRGQAFLNVVRSKTYRNQIAQLPGYSSAETGGFQ